MFAAENAAFEWFYNELGFKQPTKLYSLIKYVKEHGPNRLYYHYWQHEEGSEHGRLIVVPEDPVMAIHHKIQRFLMREFDRKPWSFGFMGGSCEESAHEHKKHRSFLKFDVRHAFFQIDHHRVVESLSRRPTFGKRHYGTISKWVARFIANLCTAQAWPEMKERYHCNTFLPQGSPTSPILFDIACDKFDERLVKIANRTHGIYTRYADNVVFSMPDRTFPPKLRRAILHEAMAFFPIHKVSQSNFGEPFRMLGLQIVDQQVRMTRVYKRKLKGALYHLNYATENGTVDERVLQKARGLMSFAIWDQLPEEAVGLFLANIKH
jgi:RNA-directed DNA polymerase